MKYSVEFYRNREKGAILEYTSKIKECPRKPFTENVYTFVVCVSELVSERIQFSFFHLILQML